MDKGCLSVAGSGRPPLLRNPAALRFDSKPPQPMTHGFAVAEFFKVFEASGCQAATGSAAVGWLIQAWVGSARIFGSAVVEKRSG